MQAPVPGPIDFQLVPYGKEHDAQTVQWLNNAELQRDFGLSRPITQESHRAWVERNPETIIWAITESDVHLGNVLLQVNVGRRAAYLQIYLGEPSSRGRGVGWAALAASLDQAFDQLDVHRVWLHTLPHNQAAEALYIKAGFIREGIEREAVFREGTFLDQSRWSLLAHEWHSARRNRTV